VAGGGDGVLVGGLLASVRAVHREVHGRPGATVIKAFNAMYATYLRLNPRRREGRQVVFCAGDNAACADFDQLIGGLGFAPVRVRGLRDGGKLVQLGGPLSAPRLLKQD
jgi:8-hydroxy-5-deazaflavin:NADPH oxidoreductase